jgi:hypothetical protein
MRTLRDDAHAGRSLGRRRWGLLAALLVLATGCSSKTEGERLGEGTDTFNFERLDLVAPDVPGSDVLFPDEGDGASWDASAPDGAGVDAEAPGEDGAGPGEDVCVPVTLFFDGDGDGYGVGEGFQSCTAGAGFATVGGDCDDSDPARNPGEVEVCDGADNDCNGIIDDGVGCACADGQTSPCGGSELGECTFGAMDCAGGVWGPCQGAVGPAAEICDGLDNDCDGQTDEGCGCEDGATQACGADTGECAPGIMICAGEAWGTCEGAVGPVDEACDGLDNDCDGQTDEGCLCVNGETGPCGSDAGLCQKGTTTCDGGLWGPCAGEVAPVEEVCDGEDNDCDGQADEGCQCVSGSTQPCGIDTGQCQVGTATCVGGTWGACAGEIAPAPEACDGLDNDCDGQTDETCACVHGATEPCGTDAGQCVKGTSTCVGGAWGPCEGAIAPAPELCDGLDNDCDGEPDETCACVHGDTAPCGSNTGLCQVGTQTCTNGAWGPCAGEVAPASEVCDGEDNDCDGQTDEGVKSTFHPDGDSDGYGAEGAGMQACVAPQGYVASNNDCDDDDGDVHPGAAEICDDKDNDCDGALNEGGVCDTCVEGLAGGGMLCVVDVYDLPAEYVQGVAWSWVDDFLYVVALGAEMFRVSKDGAVEAIPASLGLPTDVTFDGEHLWVTAVFNNGIHQVTTEGQVLATHPVEGNASPLGIAWWDGDFRVMTTSFALPGTYEIWQYAPGGGFSNPTPHVCDDLEVCVPGGMVKMNGELWHSETGGAIVRRTAQFEELDRFPTADLWEGMPTGVARSGPWLWATVSIPGRLVKMVYIEGGL